MKKFNKYVCGSLAVLLTLLFSPIIAKATLDTSSSPKEIYLTFDDGPGGKVTTETLDILKKHDVKATFFLIGNQIKGQEALVQRMVDDGHSLGLHSMTHNRNSLYSSNEGFMKEMRTAQTLIYETTNVKVNILRFPFGCNNNTYKLKKSLVNTIHDNGMKIYDWTTDSGDGANASAPPDSFIRKSCTNKDNVVLLMHCGFINKNSNKALEPIIKYYKDKGYTFKVITEETPEIFILH